MLNFVLSFQVGNMYTPSVYAALVSYLISKPAAELVNQRIALFSYGSGLAATMFSLTITADPQHLTRILKGYLN